MAEVLPPIVQSTTTITTLPTSREAFQSSSLQSHSARMASKSRSHMYTPNSGSGGYRGTSSTPVAPYAFQTTPHLRQENRTSSSPAFRNSSAQLPPPPPNRFAYPASASSTSTNSSSSSSNPSQRSNYTLSKDDSMLVQRRSVLLDSGAPALTASASTPDLLMRSADNIAKPSPDRYRRVLRRADSSNNTPTLHNQETQRYSLVLPSDRPSKGTLSGGPAPAHFRASSADDSVIGRSDGLGRYRRRSVGAIEPSGMAVPMVSTITTPAPTWAAVAAGREKGRLPSPMPASSGSLARPTSFHSRQQSHDSSSSNGSPRRPASARQDSGSSKVVLQKARPTTAPQPSPSRRDSGSNSSRGNAEPSKRPTAPSPLSQPVTSPPETPKASKAPDSPATTAAPEPASPAVQQLSALTEKDPNKSVKSRLRRAFSFGSSHELKKASGEATTPAERAKLRKEHAENIPVNDEEAAVVAKQEAAGLGASIYSGQGAFAGSTDNVSISSTASSASIMLRKMGRGVRKSTRSLKGLFRPKSIIGHPSADSAVSPSATTAEVSLVTVEAEREKVDVNVNVDPRDQPGGGTGYTKLELNSMDTSRPGTADQPGSSQENRESWARKSIIGGERERAEVLAAVRKGILKRSVTDSNSPAAATGQSESSVHLTDGSPSVPGTPDGSASADGRPDYFIATSRITNSSTKSLPGAGPHGGARNISFSPRIQFYDVWSSQEYDRRGDIATCNRLTPMLAQQIKEELNSFKMEMEVHELSKPHTHFF